jgi:hypothetical protein
MDRRAFLAAAGSLALAPRLARSATGPNVAASAMRQDLDLLADAYSELHPGLTRYLRPGEFRARASRMAAALGSEMPLSAFYLQLSALVASVQCGHSYLNPVNQSRAAGAALFGGMQGVPFTFRWLDGEMIVTGRLRDDVPLTPGTKIVSVNGVPAPVMLERMLPLARADGGNGAKRIGQLQVNGRGRYPSFEVYRHLLYPSSAPTIRVLCSNEGSRPRTLDLAPADPAIAAATIGGAVPWTFDPQGGVGTLTMPTWALYDSQADWGAFIDGAMDRLIDERARGLVVDLRGNEGGLDCGNRILARLIDRPLALPSYERRVRYRKAPDRLLPFLDTWDPGFRDWGADALDPYENGFFRLASEEEGSGSGRVLPAGRRFPGRLAVLVDAECSSATFQFAQTVQEARLGTIVGEPTGGNQRGINGGAFFFLRLPGSGLEVDLPLIGYFPPRAQPNSGLRPDQLVRPTRADLMSGRDRQREAAVRSLGRAQAPPMNRSSAV